MRTHSANTASCHLFQMFLPAWAQWDISGMEVLEGSPQASHSQWWRISPPSINSYHQVAAIGTTCGCGEGADR